MFTCRRTVGPLDAAAAGAHGEGEQHRRALVAAGPAVGGVDLDVGARRAAAVGHGAEQAAHGRVRAVVVDEDAGEHLDVAHTFAAHAVGGPALHVARAA